MTSNPFVGFVVGAVTLRRKKLNKAVLHILVMRHDYFPSVVCMSGTVIPSPAKRSVLSGGAAQ